MDFSRLKTGDWLIGGGTLLFLIAMFLPWYKLDAGFVEASASGWDYFLLGIVPLLLLIAATVMIVLPKLQPNVRIPETIGPLPRLRAALIACAIAAVLVLIRILLKDDGGVDEAEDFIDRGIGLFLATAAAIAATVGAFMKYSGKEPDTAAPGGPATPF